MNKIPLQQIPAQTLQVNLDGQQVQLLLQQKRQGLLVDVSLNGVDVDTSTIALNGVPLVSRGYMGFKGNLYFIDSDGNSDPVYTEFGTRYSLVYLNEVENALVQQ